MHRLPLDYVLRMLATPSNPAYKDIFNSAMVNHYNKNVNLNMNVLSLELTYPMRKLVSSLCITTGHSHCLPPHWKLSQPVILFDIRNKTHKKQTTNDLVYQSLFYELMESYPDLIPIYTDGSKENVFCAGCLLCSTTTNNPTTPPTEAFRRSLVLILMPLCISIVIHNYS